MRLKLVFVLAVALLLAPGLVSAQSINLEWERWDAQINVTGSNNELQVTEIQELNVLGGTVQQGTRFWTTPVDVQNVYVLHAGDRNPVELREDNSGQPGTYSISGSTNNETTVTYHLDTPQQQGDNFTVQINYFATSPTDGMVDWRIVPGEHPFPVRSSTVTIRFPNGQTPPEGLARITRGSGTVEISGDTMTIRSNGEIPANQMFAVQIPYGEGVGAAGNAGGNTGGSNPGVNPGTGTADQPTGGIQLPGMGTLLLLACFFGALLLFGGGSILSWLLRALFGGIFGGGRTTSGGGIFGRPTSGTSRGPFGGFGNSGTNRGFTRSSNQNRNVGNVGNDKDSGGGANFG